MAIVSINNIVTTQDRIILDQEYNSIINKLALGNIESDYELTSIFTEMMNFITGKSLRQEESKRFQERYNRREQRQLISALSGIRAYGGNLYSWLGSLATSCISSYFTYQNSKAEILEGLDDELWQLRKEEVQDCNDLQVRLLNASWNLLRQYKLPDEYRLTQDSLNGFFKAVSDPDPAKRLRMLKARNVERNFQVYPPYWYYRAQAAQEVKDDVEAAKCFDKFDEIWRPVLRYDPYKLEAEKYRVQTLAAKENPDKEEIRKHLDIVRDYTQDEDWSNNLFAGVAYFLLGDNDEGISCVEPNVDFGYEKDVSNIFLSEMKNGELDAFALFTLQEDIRKVIEKPETIQPEVKQPEPIKESSKPTNTKQASRSNRRRDLTKEEIIKITTKSGYLENKPGDKEYRDTYGIPYKESIKLYSHYLDWGTSASSVAFCSDGIYICLGFWSKEYVFLSYDELRNDPKITYPYLKVRFEKVHDDDFFKALMELKELE